MANFVSIETQYTPLDVEGLNKQLQQRGFFHFLFNRSSIFLIIGILAFLGSLGYSLTDQKVTTTTKADVKQKPLPISAVPIVMNPIPAKIKEFPQTYKETPIPKSLYADINSTYAIDTPGRKNYVIDKIVRFYIYQEVLEEEHLTYEEAKNDGEFANLVTDVTTMEKIIKEKLIGQGNTYASLDTLIEERLKNFK